MWHFFNYEVIGRGHEQRNIPCQDKTYKFEYNGVSVISLADGAGSAEMSHYGASRISEFVCKELAENFDAYYNDNDGINVKKRIIKVLLNELDDLSQELKCDIKNLASTMLFVAVKEDAFIIGHIGDGIIGYMKNQELKVATYPCNGEFANTTVFVTSENAITSFQLLKGKRNNIINGFVMFSDGTGASFYDKKQKRIINSVKKLINLVRVSDSTTINKLIIDLFNDSIRNNTLDDCSIVIMAESDYEGFFSLGIREKMELLSMPTYSKKSKRRIEYYQQILKILESPCSIKDLSVLLHIQQKYVVKKISKLIQLNLVSVCYGKYKSNLRFRRKNDE